MTARKVVPYATGARTPLPGGKRPRLAVRRGAPAFRRAPEELRELLAKPIRYGGPAPIPEGFVHATTSGVEWIAFYWLWIVLVGDESSYGGPRNPDNWHGPPDRSFTYQKIVEGGRRVVGGSIADFLVHNTYYIRLMGEWQHTAAHNEKQVRDLLQISRLQRDRYRVIDVFEQHLLVDWERPNGGAHHVIRDATMGIQWPSPITHAQVYRVRAKLGD